MHKSIGLLSIFCISSGAMISSGLFVLPGLAYANAGPVVFLSYFIAGCVALTTVLSLSELITAMPKGGGDYFYVSRTFGPLFGTVSGLLSWLALSLKSAFAIIGLAELIYLSFGINFTLSALALTVFFTILNLAGVKEAVRFQIVLVIALFAILALFSVTGLQDIVMTRYEPFLSRGFSALISTAGFVFVSFGGVLTTASIAGEIRNPSKNVPAGLIGSTIAVTIVYSLVTMIVVGVVPGETLEKSLNPVATAGSAVGGMPMYAAITIAALLAFITTANGGILTASRYPVALARDRMLPKLLLRTGRKKGTPWAAITATGILIALSVLLKLDILVKAASTVVLLSNIFAHLSVIVMRESKVSNYLPTFRAPLYPWVQVFGIIVFTLLIVNMGIEPILFSLLFVFAGVILFFIRRRQSETISPAFIHLIERITNKKLGTKHLSDELRDIISDRDHIIKDEFDEAIESSSFLDSEAPMELNEFFEKISTMVHNSLPFLKKPEIEALLKERESESSTAISNFAAIPHIIVKGESVFSVFLARSKSGIRFSPDNQSVKAVFILIGTKDTRNLHLRALAAIAQVIQHPDFEKRWLSARNHTEIKDLFLLSKRKRKGGH
ncbi:MAG: amino acid permease [Chitinivibrionales bacterium]|nr:amino acid permease [Chitinivibrionales bacterium]